MQKGFPYEQFIQEVMIMYLEGKGYTKVVNASKLWEHGVDIKVRNKDYSRYWIIEVKGGSTSKNARSVDTNNFVFGLGQIVMRIQSVTEPKASKGSNKYGVAYPDYFKKYLERKRLHWNLCKNLNLTIFLVGEDGVVGEYDWKRIKKEFY